MIKLFLHFALILCVTILLSYLSKWFLKKYLDKNSKKILNIDDDLADKDYKVIKEMDIKHTTIYSDNLLHTNKKATRNLYRGADGRFKSLKNE